VGETYNVGGWSERTNLEVVRRLCAVVDNAFAHGCRTGRRFPRAPAAAGRETVSLLTFVTDRPGHDRRYAIDARKIEASWASVPPRASRAGCGGPSHWYLEHEPWWRATMDGSYATWIQRWYTDAGR
jgi:dTDP-glucose 4,6-dehydratase